MTLADNKQKQGEFVMKEKILTVASGAGISTLSYLVGGWSVMLSTLLLFMMLDVVTGWMKGIYTGKLSSKFAFKSITIKKLGILIAVVIAHQLDVVAVNELTAAALPFDGPAMLAIIVWFLGMEFISINENLGEFVKLPTWWKNIFESLKEK